MITPTYTTSLADQHRHALLQAADAARLARTARHAAVAPTAAHHVTRRGPRLRLRRALVPRTA